MQQDENDNEYSAENFLKLPKDLQVKIYFGVAQELFKRNQQTTIAIEFMNRALKMAPNLAKWLIYGDCYNDN